MPAHTQTVTASLADKDVDRDTFSTTGLTHAIVKAFLTETDASLETLAGGSLIARQAASCLLAPVIGDRVLVYVDGEEAFILAVLVRSADHAAEIAVPGVERVVLSAKGRLDIHAPHVSIGTGRLDVVAKALFQAGDRLTSHFRRITETVVDKVIGARTITTQAETRTAAIRDVELLSAGTLVQTIDSVSTQKSEIALMTAKRDVRIDAERVSVG